MNLLHTPLLNIWKNLFLHFTLVSHSIDQSYAARSKLIISLIREFQLSRIRIFDIYIYII